MKPVIDYTLYLVTDRDLMSTETLEQAVEAACAGGVTLVQLREKHASRSEFVDLARRVKRVCDKHDIPLIINDEPEIAVEIGAANLVDPFACKHIIEALPAVCESYGITKLEEIIGGGH